MSVSRNAPCPCGSGKKYKKCCLEKDEQARLEAKKEAEESSKKKYLDYVWDEDEEEWESEYYDDSDEEDEFDDDEYADDEIEEDDEPIEVWYDPNQLNFDFMEEEFLAKERKRKAIKVSSETKKPDKDELEEIFYQFERREYEDKITCFLQALSFKNINDSDLFFDMLDDIHTLTIRHNQRHRYDELVKKLAQEKPKTFKANGILYLRAQILNALLRNDVAKVSTLVELMMPYAKNGFDILNLVLHMLIFYDYHSLVVQAVQKVWPMINNFKKINTWGIEDFREKVHHFSILDFIQANPEFNPESPQFLQLARRYYENLIIEFELKNIRILQGKIKREWQHTDFDIEPLPQKFNPKKNHFEMGKLITEQQQDNLIELVSEFVHFSMSQGNKSPVRAKMAALQIYEYLHLRAEGELEPESFDEILFPDEPQPTQPLPVTHILCPDYETLNQFFAEMLDMIFVQPHKAAILLELLPEWFAFLETTGLIDKNLARAHYQQIKKYLVANIVKLFSRFAEDPNLFGRVQRAWRVVFK